MLVAQGHHTFHPHPDRLSDNREIPPPKGQAKGEQLALPVNPIFLASSRISSTVFGHMCRNLGASVLGSQRPLLKDITLWHQRPLHLGRTRSVFSLFAATVSSPTGTVDLELLLIHPQHISDCHCHGCR